MKLLNQVTIHKKKLYITTLFLFLSLYSIFGFWIGQEAIYMGPSEWDDVFYCDTAAMQEMRWELRNRYVHIWSIRIFNQLFESRHRAAAVLANLAVVGIGIVAFFWARRFGNAKPGELPFRGIVIGGFAALFALFFHPLYRFISIPYVDPPMAFWGLLGLFMAVKAGESKRLRSIITFGLISGFACYFSLKCKETGLAIIPPALVMLISSEKKWQTAVAWIGGIIAGWLALMSMDAAFAPTSAKWWSSDWGIYFGSKASGGGIGGIAGGHSGHSTYTVYKTGKDFVLQMADTRVIPYTILGIIGTVIGFKENRSVQALSLWALSSLTFLSIIGWKYIGINAEPRYVVAIGVPLVLLGAYALSDIWKRTFQGKDELNNLYFLVPLFFIFMWIPLNALYKDIWKIYDFKNEGATFYILPVSFIFLSVAAWATKGTYFGRLALTSLLVLVAATTSRNVYLEHEKVNKRLDPWRKAAALSDKYNKNIALLSLGQKKLDSIPVWRIRRKVRILSQRPAGQFVSRRINKIEDLKPNEWVLVAHRRNAKAAKKVAELKEQKWRQLIYGKTKGFERFWILAPPKK